MPSAPGPIQPVTVSLIAYEPEGILRGAIELRHDRTSHMLEEGDPLPVFYAARERHSDGSITHMGRLEVPQRELVIVLATGPDLDLARRPLAQARCVRITVAGYSVTGRVLVPPGREPGPASADRGWLAVTEVLLRYHARGAERAHLHEAVLVNGSLVESIVPVDAADQEQEHRAAEARIRAGWREREYDRLPLPLAWVAASGTP